jgi:hypothetical protein
MTEYLCQMTVTTKFEDLAYLQSYDRCNRPAKYRNPQPQMGIEFVCGVHARSLDKMYKRIGSDVRCLPLSGVEVAK